MLVFTHFQRLLDYMVSDLTQVLVVGRIVLSGGPDLVEKLVEHGYRWIIEDTAKGVGAR